MKSKTTTVIELQHLYEEFYKALGYSSTKETDHLNAIRRKIGKIVENYGRKLFERRGYIVRDTRSVQDYNSQEGTGYFRCGNDGHAIEVFYYPHRYHEYSLRLFADAKAKKPDAITLGIPFAKLGDAQRAGEMMLKKIVRDGPNHSQQVLTTKSRGIYFYQDPFENKTA